MELNMSFSWVPHGSIQLVFGVHFFSSDNIYISRPYFPVSLAQLLKSLVDESLG